jgi:hypothetical protein
MNSRRGVVRLLSVALAVLVLLPLPVGAANLLALVDTGEIFSSGDGGATWTGIATVSVSDAVDIFAGNASSELYFGTRTGVVFRSTDSGASWTAQGTIPASDIVAVTARVNGYVLALSETGAVYESTDEGTTFAAIATITGSDFVSLVEMGITRDLYALSETGGVYRSTDDGVTWTAVGVVLSPDAREIEALDNDLYVMTGTGGIAQSTNNGATWTFVGTLSQVGMEGMTVDADTLVVGSVAGHVATSTDGATWTWQGSINQLRLMALGTDEPTATGIPDGPPGVPSLELRSIFPNPGSGDTQVFSFSIELGAPEAVSYEVFDVSGRRVAGPVEQSFPSSGAHLITWSPAGLRSGVYFVRVHGEMSGVNARRKLVIVR